MSLFGCGTVTRPGFVGCVNCQWLPFVATCTQPSCWSIRMSLLLSRSNSHSLLCINIHKASLLNNSPPRKPIIRRFAAKPRRSTARMVKLVTSVMIGDLVAAIRAELSHSYLCRGRASPARVRRDPSRIVPSVTAIWPCPCGLMET